MRKHLQKVAIGSELSKVSNIQSEILKMHLVLSKSELRSTILEDLYLVISKSVSKRVLDRNHALEKKYSYKKRTAKNS